MSYRASLEILVAGEPGNEKINFIKGFLKNFPPNAIARKGRAATTYCVDFPGRLRIQLHDFNSVVHMESSVYDYMDVVIFPYAANNPESPKNLEKWISLMGVEAKKEVLTILLYGWGDLDRQRLAANSLAEQANMLRDIFGLKLAILSSSDALVSAIKVFDIIMKEIPTEKITPKYSCCFRRPSFGKRNFLSQNSNEVPSQSSSNCGRRYAIEGIRYLTHCPISKEGIYTMECYVKELKV